MAERVEGYIKGSTTKNAIKAAKNAPLPPRTIEEDESSEVELEDDDAKDSQDEDQNGSGDELIAAGRSSKDKTATVGATSTNFNQTTKRFGGLGPGLGGGKDTRKAPLACNMSKKSRFPLIVKPDCMSQGKGIFLTNDLSEIPRDETYVVQQYMQNPYLIDGLKFDLRLYVLVLSCEPLKIFLYQEGMVRFATHQYKPIE